MYRTPNRRGWPCKFRSSRLLPLTLRWQLAARYLHCFTFSSVCASAENFQWMLVSLRTQQKMGSQATAGVVESLVTYGSPLVTGCQGIPVLSRPRRQETSSQVTAGFSGCLAMYGSLLITGVRSPCWRRLCSIGDVTPVAVWWRYRW